MGEALLIKFGGTTEVNYGDIEIQPDKCAILAEVRDSGGNIVTNCDIKCYSDGVWQNYSTNETGKALFYVANNADIWAYNYSSVLGYNFIDQSAVSTSVNNIKLNKLIQVNVALKKKSGYTYNFTKNNTNCRFLDSNQVFVQLVGGGGGSAFQYGAGGGAYNEGYMPVNRMVQYSIVIGNGGKYGNSNVNNTRSGSTGGTTSAFGLSAVGGKGSKSYGPGEGGGSGNFKGGNGGDMSNGYYANYRNASFPYGGGGGGGSTFPYKQDSTVVNMNSIDGVVYSYFLLCNSNISNHIGNFLNGTSTSYNPWTMTSYHTRNYTIETTYYGVDGGGTSGNINVGSDTVCPYSAPSTNGTAYYYLWVLNTQSNEFELYKNNSAYDNKFRRRSISYNRAWVHGHNGTNGTGGGAGGDAVNKYSNGNVYLASRGSGSYGGSGRAVITIV